MIILTWQQANLVRGLTKAGHALAPVPIAVSATAALAGKFALPESCLTDPAHAQYADLLASFPRVLDSSIVKLYWETDPAILSPNRYVSTWQVGQTVPFNSVG